MAKSGMMCLNSKTVRLNTLSREIPWKMLRNRLRTTTYPSDQASARTVGAGPASVCSITTQICNFGRLLAPRSVVVRGKLLTDRRRTLTSDTSGCGRRYFFRGDGREADPDRLTAPSMKPLQHNRTNVLLFRCSDSSSTLT